MAKRAADGFFGASGSGFKYGEALPKDFNIPSAFRWILDKDLTVNNPFDQVVMEPGARVMDCGAAVGTFSAAALEQGAGRVYSYEPLPETAAVLRDNLRRYGKKSEVFERALSPDGRAWVELHGTGFPGNHSLVERPSDKGSLSVRAVSFRAEVLRLVPDVIKLDVEGAEYDLLASLRKGDLVKTSCMFIEFHPITDRDSRLVAVKSFLAEEGFVVVKDRLRAFTLIKG
jgi:FkbM family methyltransferase